VTRTVPAKGQYGPPLLVLPGEKYESFGTASVYKTINTLGLSVLNDSRCVMKTTYLAAVAVLHLHEIDTQTAEWRASYVHIPCFRFQNYFPFKFFFFFVVEFMVLFCVYR
jgi:hypothetical protein